MKPPECELRTEAFPYAYYPAHWGPFAIHDLFPMVDKTKSLDVEFFYICTTPSKSSDPIILGFDDFAPVWPVDPELSEKAIKRRDKFRERAEFRALVRVRRVKHLTAEGIERLRDLGADVSEGNCQSKEGFYVAVMGKYRNFPMYNPQRGTFHLPYLHELGGGIHPSQSLMGERNLHLVSIDGRTLLRSMLYIERIKLLRFMIETHRENRETVPVDERDIDWFITKYMEKYLFAQTGVRKPKEYRGARKHTSEARHCFVVHAEWMLHCTTLSEGSERVIRRKVLEKWAEDAPAKREGAARDGRDGWGKWDSQWDQGDVMESYKKETVRLRYYIAQIRHQIDEAGSGNEAGDEDEDVEMASVHSQEGLKNRVLARGGKVKGGNYMHAWIHIDQSEDDTRSAQHQEIEEDELVSLDEADDASSKRRKSNSGTSLWSRQSASTRPTSSPSRSGWGNQHSSPSLKNRALSSPSLGAAGPRSSQSLGAGPSSRPPTAGPSRWSTAGAGSSGTQNLSSLKKRVEIIVLSSDPDDEPVQPTSPPAANIPSDGDEEMADPPLAIKRESTASSARRSDDEEVIPESDVESVAHSSDSETKYAKKSRPPHYTPEQLKKRELGKLHAKLYRFAPVIFHALEMPDSWAPWHCECPPMSMPFPSPQSVSSKYKCKYLIDLRHPSDDVVRLMRNSSEPSDAELLKHLITKPSVLLRPWDDLAAQILKRIVELHWEEHYTIWGVKKVVVLQPDMQVRAHFEYMEQ